MWRYWHEGLVEVKEIELVGLPGSGKSTLYRALLAQQDSLSAKLVSKEDVSFLWAGANADVVRRYFGRAHALMKLGDRLPTRARKAIARISRPYLYHCYANESAGKGRDIHAPAFKSYLGALARCDSESVSLMRRTDWLLEHVMVQSLAHGHGGENVLLSDEGVLQRAFSLAMEGVDVEDVRGFLKLALRPQLCIYVRAPADVRRERLVKRDGMATPWMISSEADSAMAAVISIAEQEGMPVLSLDGAKTTETLRREVAEHFRTLRLLNKEIAAA